MFANKLSSSNLCQLFKVSVFKFVCPWDAYWQGMGYRDGSRKFFLHTQNPTGQSRKTCSSLPYLSKGAGLDGPLRPRKFCDSIDTFKSAFCNIQKTALDLVEVPLWKLYRGLQLGKPILPEVDISWCLFFFSHFKQLWISEWDLWISIYSFIQKDLTLHLCCCMK